jgi:hypothetical protein
MSDRLDQEIRSMVVELVESSPAPHPAHAALRAGSLPVRPVTMRSGLGRAFAAAVVVLLVGLAGAWIGRSVIPPDTASDVSIVEGTPAPEPGFEPFGEQMRLLPSTGEVQPEIAPGTIAGEVTAVGRIQDTDLEVFIWQTTEPANGTCLQVIGFRAKHTTCEGALDSEPDIRSPFAFARFDETTSDPIDVIAVWRVPDNTSILQVGVSDMALWQRPNSGVVAFAFDPEAPRVILNAVDIDSEGVGTSFFSPVQVANPEVVDDITLQGSPQDLVELDDNHPAVQLLAEGATDYETFAETASERDLQFTCAAGGGWPAYQLCLVAHDGVLAVVPFDGLPGLTARISEPNLAQDVVVPLNRTEPVGVLNTRPNTGVDIEYFGEETVGGMSAPWSPSRNDS